MILKSRSQTEILEAKHDSGNLHCPATFLFTEANMKSEKLSPLIVMAEKVLFADVSKPIIKGAYYKYLTEVILMSIQGMFLCGEIRVQF